MNNYPSFTQNVKELIKNVFSFSFDDPTVILAYSNDAQVRLCSSYSTVQYSTVQYFKKSNTTFRCTVLYQLSILLHGTRRYSLHSMVLMRQYIFAKSNHSKSSTF